MTRARAGSRADHREQPVPSRRDPRVDRAAVEGDLGPVQVGHRGDPGRKSLRRHADRHRRAEPRPAALRRHEGTIPRSEIEEQKASTTSVMPEGLLNPLELPGDRRYAGPLRLHAPSRRAGERRRQGEVTAGTECPGPFHAPQAASRGRQIAEAANFRRFAAQSVKPAGEQLGTMPRVRATGRSSHAPRPTSHTSPLTWHAPRSSGRGPPSMPRADLGTALTRREPTCYKMLRFRLGSRICRVMFSSQVDVFY